MYSAAGVFRIQEMVNSYRISPRLKKICCPVLLTWFRRTSDWSFGRSNVRQKEVGAARVLG